MMSEHRKFRLWRRVLLCAAALVLLRPNQVLAAETRPYLMLDNVYPFEEAELLSEKITLFEDSGYPFLIVVMPVYHNTEYPAMSEFCQILRHAQSEGAAIVLGYPICQGTEPDLEEADEKLAEAADVYLSYGVYPTGVKFLENQEEAMTDSAPGISGRFTSEAGGAGEEHPITAIDSSESAELIEKKLNAYQKSGAQFDDYRAETSTFSVGDVDLEMRGGTVFLHGTAAAYTPEDVSYEGYDYHRTLLGHISVDLKQSNRYLIAISIAAILIFGIFMGYTRRRARKRFLK